MKAFGPAIRGNEDVAQKLSGLSATHGKERTHGDDPLFLWEIYLEGLAGLGRICGSKVNMALTVALTLTAKMAR